MYTFARLLSLEPFERRPGRVLTGIGIVFVAAYVTALTVFPHGRLVNGDTIQYYAYLRSIAIDGDVDFTNDYRLLYGPAAGDGANTLLTARTSTGYSINLMSIGPALLWAPFFLATYAALVVLQPFGVVVPLDGIAAPFVLSAGIAGIVYATLGAFLCYRSCRLLFPAGPAFWGALVAWLATPALYYSLVSPAYSHATSLFASALFAYVWLKTLGDVRIRRYLWLGLLAGLAALVRWQDVVILALPMLELADQVVRRRSAVRPAAVGAAMMLAALGAAMLPQLLAWRAIYGQLLLMPQGGGFMRWTSPAILSVLFSLRHGLFSWTPAVLLAAVGLYYLIRRNALAGSAALVVVVVTVYVNASVDDWWAGEAFGARRFVSDTVFFAWGLAALFAEDFWRRRATLLRWTAVVLVTYNLLFLVQYQLFMRGLYQFASYPTTLREVLLDRLILPWNLLRAWLG